MTVAFKDSFCNSSWKRSRLHCLRSFLLFITTLWCIDFWTWWRENDLHTWPGIVIVCNLKLAEYNDPFYVRYSKCYPIEGVDGNRLSICIKGNWILPYHLELSFFHESLAVLVWLSIFTRLDKQMVIIMLLSPSFAEIQSLRMSGESETDEWLIFRRSNFGYTSFFVSNLRPMLFEMSIDFPFPLHNFMNEGKQFHTENIQVVWLLLHPFLFPVWLSV